MAPSKMVTPPTPTRCIHSRSSLMPSLEMLPFIQCHHTRGRAPLGGSRNPRSNASVSSDCGAAGACARVEKPAAHARQRNAAKNDLKAFMEILPDVNIQAQKACSAPHGCFGGATVARVAPVEMP